MSWDWLSKTGFGTDIPKNATCAFYCKEKSKHPLIYAQYNPEKLEYGISATYSEMNSPGMNYPVFQFVRGNSHEFQLELFMYEGRGGTGHYIRTLQKWFEECLPPQGNNPGKHKKGKKKGKYKKYVTFDPPIINVRVGYYKFKSVLKDMHVSDEWLNENGKPIMTKLSLTFIKTGSTNVSFKGK